MTNVNADSANNALRPNAGKGQPQKPIDDLQCDAVQLHGVLQGLEILMNEAPTSPNPIHNAINALCMQATLMADSLAQNLDTTGKAGVK